MLKWFAVPFPRVPRFVRTLHMTRLSWVALRGMAHSFTELDKALGHVIRLGMTWTTYPEVVLKNNMVILFLTF